MKVCLFCGSSEGRLPEYGEAASRFGRAIASHGHSMIYGGAKVGLMGIAADAALAGDASVVGVLPRKLADRELAHESLTELVMVESMHARKHYMAENCDAFAVLPGGAGTHDEFFEMWTWVQIGVHDKPIGFLNVAGFFDPLFAFIDHMVDEGFLGATFRDTLIRSSDPAELLDRLQNYEGTPTKWETE